MLTKGDKEFIKQSIKEGIKEELTVEWTLEKVRDEKTGQPLAVKELKKEKVFIPSMFIQLMPYLEGSLRGMQEDVEKNNNKINDMGNQIQVVGSILAQTEESLRCLAALSDHVKQLGLNSPKLIDVTEVNDESSNT